MSSRQRLLAVLNGQEPSQGVFCPLVDWRYACQFTGRDVLHPDYMDQVRVAEACGYDPIVIVDRDLQPYNPNLKWKVARVTETADYRDQLRVLETPVGTVSTVWRATGGLAWLIEPALKAREDYKWSADPMGSSWARRSSTCAPWPIPPAATAVSGCPHPQGAAPKSWWIGARPCRRTLTRQDSCGGRLGRPATPVRKERAEVDKVRVALVGCGVIADVMHLPGLKTMREMGKVDLVAICDDMHRTPGVEMSSGSQGHGICVALGMALAARMDGAGYRVFTIIGDGESDEGTVWEAAMAAAHHKMIIAQTVKGKGLPWAEGRAEWHYGNLTAQQWEEVTRDWGEKAR